MIQIFCTPYVKPVKIDEAQAADPHKRIAIGLAVNQQRLFLAGKPFFIFTPGDAVLGFCAQQQCVQPGKRDGGSFVFRKG